MHILSAFIAEYYLSEIRHSRQVRVLSCDGKDKSSGPSLTSDLGFDSQMVVERSSLSPIS